jgi:hypothetical protein
MSGRFVEPEEGSGMWASPWLVVCPRCGAAAQIDRRGGADTRLTCGSCGLTHMGPAGVGDDGRVEQWPHHYALLLREPCCGGRIVWATNEQHLAYLEGYVGASVRSTRPFPTKPLSQKLPTWMKEAKHRDEVLAALARMRERLPV